VKTEGMARQLWLLRHADAEPHGTRPDAERRLTERGERQARIAGQALSRMNFEPDAILCSPKERALRTGVLALEAWDERWRAALEVHAPLRGGFDGSKALAAMAKLGPDGRMLAVGHEPDLSSVVNELTGGSIDLKKGGLAVVRLGRAIERPERASAAAGGELVLLLRPLDLALIAGVAESEV
jgi:phosphohistidine phosphatase